jgi:rubrerythrin
MDDRSESSTATAYHCPKCGTDFEADENTCPTCGFVCSDETCKILSVSKEGF